jgi:hypothetical protein
MTIAIICRVFVVILADMRVISFLRSIARAMKRCQIGNEPSSAIFRRLRYPRDLGGRIAAMNALAVVRS